MATAKYSRLSGPFVHRLVSLSQANEKGLRLARDAGVEALDSPTREELSKAVAETDILQVEFWNNPHLFEFLQSDWPASRVMMCFHVAGHRPPHLILPELIDYSDMAVVTGAVSQTLPVFRDLPEEIRKEKTDMVLDSPDLSRIRGVRLQPHSSFHVTYLGTVDFIKMHPHFVRMSASLNIPDVHILVYGLGNGFATLKKEAEVLGAGQRFVWGGFVENIRPVLEVTDVFGYPLCEENYATSELVLAEVMSAGIPPVIFAYGGPSFVVQDHKTGLIVHSESEYKEAIEFLFHHPQERLRLGENARTFALTNLGAENQAPHLNQVYQRLLEKPKRKHLSVFNRRLDQETINSVGPHSTPCDLTGAELFIRSMGGKVPEFIMSMTSERLEQLLEAEKRIALSPPIIGSADGGVLLDYRLHFPRDPYLRLWTGLIFHRYGRYALAAAEFQKTINLGFPHWRVQWYLAQSAARAGAELLAEQAIQEVKRQARWFDLKTGFDEKFLKGRE